MISSVILRDERLALVRQLRPDDEARLQEFVGGLSVASRLERFFAPIARLAPRHLDAILASPGLSLGAFDDDGRIVALGQYALGGDDAELALVVAEDWRRNSLGERLLAYLSRHAGYAGARVRGGLMLAHNRPMRRLVQKLGFALSPDPDPALVRFAYRA